MYYIRRKEVVAAGRGRNSGNEGWRVCATASQSRALETRRRCYQRPRRRRRHRGGEREKAVLAKKKRSETKKEKVLEEEEEEEAGGGMVEDDDVDGRKGELVYGKVGRTAECGNFSYKI